MEFIALSKMVRVSPRKVRVVADAVKKYAPNVAMQKLQFLAKSAAQPILKALQSAVANSKLDIGQLKIKNILVDEGQKMRRQDKSHGARYNSGIIHKRMSHIKIILEG